MIEIRWHGRGGQGTKTAALLLADVAFSTGKFVQGFPEYGPERMGAPITAYNRISENEIRIHSNIYHPDYVAVVDETLLGAVNVAQGLKEGGSIVLNTSRSKTEIHHMFDSIGGSIYTIDARKVSLATLEKYFPNTPMLAAIVKISGIIPQEEFLEQMELAFQHKFASKPEIIDGNMKALVMALQEVQ